MHFIRMSALLLMCLLCGCRPNTAKEAEPVPAVQEVTVPAEETPAPRESRLAFIEEEGPEEDIFLTFWSYAGQQAADFYTLLLPLPEEFSFPAGTMYEGDDAALLGGVVTGDRESGTAEYILADKDGNAETVLTLMYSHDRVALLELDADMLSFCRQDKNTGLWTVVFTDDGPLGFADAGLMLEGITEKYAMAPVYREYGLEAGKALDLSLQAVSD